MGARAGGTMQEHSAICEALLQRQLRARPLKILLRERRRPFENERLSLHGEVASLRQRRAHQGH
jgi:hypothetical protein